MHEQDQMQSLLLRVRVLDIARLSNALTGWALVLVPLSGCSRLINQLLDDLAEQLDKDEPALAQGFNSVDDDLAL